MDWDEELKRQAAISALLAPPEAQDQAQSDGVYPTVAQDQDKPDVVQPEDKSDYHKLVNKAFDQTAAADIPTIDQASVAPSTAAAPPGHIDLAPPQAGVAEPGALPDESTNRQSPAFATMPDTSDQDIVWPDQGIPAGHIDLGPPRTPEQVAWDQQYGHLRTDPESGVRYATDPQTGDLIPHAELATEADKKAFKPGDVTLPQTTVEGTAEAPDKLTQVERAQLVQFPKGVPATMPWHPAGQPPAPDQLTQVERALPTGPKAPGAHTELAPPGQMDLRADTDVVPAQPSTQPTAQPTAQQPAVVQPSSFEDYNKLIDSLWPSAESKAKKAAATTDTGETRVMTGGASLAGTDDRITQIVSNAARVLPPGYTIRSTSGVRTSGQGQHTLGKAQDWQIYGPDGKPVVNRGDDSTGLYTKLARAAYGYQEKNYPELTGKFQWGGQFGTSANNPNEPDLMHFDIGGRRGRIERYSRESIGAVLPPEAGTKTVAGAAPEEPPINTLVKLDQSGLNVTHYGYKGDENLDSESAAGHGKYIKNMIPGYDVALNAAAAAMVGNPKPGETFQFAGKEWRYADKVPEKYSDARFDIFDKDGTALTGSTPVGKSVAVAQPAAEKQPWDSWLKLSPADQAAAETAGRTREIGVLDQINQNTKNPAEIWKALQSPIRGVSDTVRQGYADNFKQELTKYAQNFYGESDPDKAFARAIGPAGIDTFVGQAGRAFSGTIGQADVGLNQMGKSIDLNRVDNFAKLIHPESEGTARADFIKTLTGIGDTRHRHDVFNEIYGNLDQNTKDAIGDPASILESIDHLASPEYQASQAKALAIKKAWVDKQLESDPTLKGTPGEWWSTGTGQNIATVALSAMPLIARTSAFGAQIYSANEDRIAKEHPDWTSQQVSEESAKSAFMQLAPQELLTLALGGKLAPLMNWAKNPVVRFGIGGGIHLATGAASGALQQIGGNIAENKAPLENVGPAAVSGMLQATPFVVHGGIEAVKRGGPETHPAPVEPAPVEPAPVEPAPEPPPRPVTRADILRPEEPTPPAPARPWYMQGAEPGQDPLVIRGAERTAFTPQELADLVNRAPSDSTPAELRNLIEQARSPTGMHLEGTFERSGGRWEPQPGNLEVEQTRQMRVNQPPITPTELLSPKTVAEAIRQAKADAVAAQLGGTPRVVPKSGEPAPARVSAGGETDFDRAYREKYGTNITPKPGNISGEEPRVQQEANKSTLRAVADELTKGVANKYAEERMKAGELEPIDPNTGLTTEELMARALKMRPQEVEQHISNFMDNRGGDPRDHAAAVRTREAFLTDRNRALSLKAETNPRDVQAQSEAASARKALNDFYTKGGPISKMKELFHVHGKGLQGEPSIDLSTEGGLHEKFLRETDRPPPPKYKPRLQKAAERVRTTHTDEYNARSKVDKAIDKDVRKKIPSIEEVRDYVAKRMTQMPCRK